MVSGGWHLYCTRLALDDKPHVSHADEPSSNGDRKPDSTESRPKPRSAKKNSHWPRIGMACALLGLFGALWIWQRGGGAKSGQQPPAPAGQKDGNTPARTGPKQTDAEGKKSGGAVPVVAARAHKGSIGVNYFGLGTVTPINTVTIRSRVDGQLMKVYYREGDMVRSGDPLIDLDPRPFEVQLEQAQGQFVRDVASLENARVDLSRYATLLKQNAVQEQVYRTQIATVAQFEGAVETDRGVVNAAKLNITYSKITAPLTGLIGLRLVDPGNIVHATDTNGLLVITQLEPISVLFTIAEDQLQTVIRKVTSGQRLLATAFDRSDQTRIADGTLTTIDNQIDPTTGTLRLRAIFDNKNRHLFPNQFVNIRLLVQQKNGVVLMPVAAIQRTTTKEFVYIVKADSTVTVRPITEGVTDGDQVEVTSGVSPGDAVVVTGVDRLQEGTRVRVQMPAATPSGKRGKKQ